MWDLFKYILDFIVAKSPIFLAFIVVIAVTAWVTQYVISHNSKHKSLDNFDHTTCNKHTDSVSEIKSKMNNLETISTQVTEIKAECNKHSSDISKVKESVKQHDISVRLVDDLKQVTDKLSDTVNTIQTWVMKSDPDMIDPIMKKNSPYKLTPAGVYFLDKSGGKECIDENKDFFINKLKDTNPNTELDVELNAKSVLFSNFNNAIFNDIKKFLYYSPEDDTYIDESGNETKFKITMPVLLNVMSIYLRDLYLKNHPFQV